MATITFESLPVDVILDILSELDLSSLIVISYLSKRLYSIASDSSLNPWRGPILRNLQAGVYEPCLKNLSVRYVVPRQNWVDIMSRARSDFLLWEATIPNLKAHEWEQCFRRRFLPGWCRWKKEGHWKEAFMKILHRVWHRSQTTCTTDEAWTKYIVLNRNGSVNELESSSRNFNPSVIFNDMKYRSNLTHLETRIRLVVEFTDVRILAFGALGEPGAMFQNPNAHRFLHPPGIESAIPLASGHNFGRSIRSSDEFPEPDRITRFQKVELMVPTYTRLTLPEPSLSHADYPFHTSGGRDKRWVSSGALEEDGLQWVGGLLLTAQLIGPYTHKNFVEGSVLQDVDLVVGLGRNQYSSFTWMDFMTIAPWMEEAVTKIIFGPGLGN